MSSLTQALRILKLLDPAQPQLRVGEVSRQTGIAKASVSRLLAELAEAGYLLRDPVNRSYSAGPALLVPAALFVQTSAHFQDLQALSARLAQDHGCASFISRLHADKLLILALNRAVGVQGVSRDVGDRLWPFRTTSGRAMLARLAAPQRQSMLMQDDIWSRDITAAEQILREVRAVGICAGRSDASQDISVMAAAVQLSDRGGATAVTLTWQRETRNAAQVREMIRHFRAEISAMGRRFGDPQWAL